MKQQSVGVHDNSKRVRVLVLTGFGLNCDIETAHAFELAGADAQRVHINSLISGKVELDPFHILAFGGGFSWGDDHGAGVIQALKLKNHIGDKILSFISQGKLVIGICNGFQTLVNLGLLPGVDRDYQTRSVALTWNDCGNFRDQWVNMVVNPNSPCVFTKEAVAGISSTEEEVIDGDTSCAERSGGEPSYHLELPVRHAQGKFVASPSVIERLIAENLVVLRYAALKADESGMGKNGQNPDEKRLRPLFEPAMQRFPMNPNGSVYDIAGICDPSGHIFGLMPHPEAYNHYTNHPDWTIRGERIKRGAAIVDGVVETRITPGMKIFLNGVNYMASRI